MKKIYVRPAAFVEKIELSDVVSLDCSTIYSTVTDANGVWTVGGLAIFNSSNGGCEWDFDNLDANNTICYEYFGAEAASLFSS